MRPNIPKLDKDQRSVLRIAKEELFRGRRVTISPKRFGHSRKHGSECDIETS